MIDFSKIGTGNTADTVFPPREIFNALPNKNEEKFKYPRDVQSQVWSKWFESRNDNSLVIKMNTGAGKTVVGLLILKSCINEGKAPAVYVCPDKYLVDQVVEAARELGIEVTKNVDSPRFLSGKSILIANVYKLVNGKSVFGVGDEGVKLDIASLVVDDAHACLKTIEDQFTLTIPADLDLYEEIYGLFKSSLHDQCESKAIEIENEEPGSYLQVPYWVWQDKLKEVTEIIVKHRKEEKVRFVWPLIKENLKLSRCVVGSQSIEISPHNIPIHMLPSIDSASRKVFMTATLVDDSILASHFGVAREYINNPIVPDSAADIGDRMILLPQVINADLSDQEIKSYCKKLSHTLNVVVIVPSNYRAEYWRKEADRVLTSSNIHKGVEELKAGHVGLTILVNKYDGIDLPGSACRVLVIDGLPDVRRMIDKVEQSVLSGTSRYSNQVIQRIEQGMGRGVRSNDDYCVVFLVGRELTSQLYSYNSISKLSPGTKAQLEISDQLSEQIKGKGLEEVSEAIGYCLDRRDEWVTTSKGVLASLTYSDAENAPDEISLGFRKAYDEVIDSNPVRAKETLDGLTCFASDKRERGYVKQVLAEYVNLLDRAEAQRIQMSASTDNRRVLNPIDGISYHKISGDIFDQAVESSNFLKNRFDDPNKLIIEMEGLIDELQFKEGTSSVFEEALKNIARYIGFQSQRPEIEFKKGPDVLWRMGSDRYLVIECKNEAKNSLIPKGYCNQLNGSANWFRDKYGSFVKFTPVMVHLSDIFEHAASPDKQIRILNREGLERLLEAVRGFVRAVASSNELGSPEAIRDRLVAYKLRPTDVVDVYTKVYRVKSSA